jgi:polyisoprenyl-teichoic acid--peptidoglycan teichoic acid transferase
MTAQPRRPARTALIILVALLIMAAIVAAILVFTAGTGAPEPSPSAEPTPTPTPIPTEEALNQDLLTNRLTVLLVGIDTNERRASQGATLNTDALMLVSISDDQSELTLVSLPRDTVDIPLGDGSIWDRKINGLYATQGIDALVGAMEELYGVPIDGHLALDMDDLVTLVDAVDGVTVDPPTRLVDPPIGLDVQPGEQVLDGETALSYVRTRVDQDYGRMGRQQEVVQSLVAELTADDAEVELATLVAGLDSLETDLPLEDLPTFVEIGRRLQDADVTELLVGPPEMIVFEGDRGDGRGYILEPDVEAIRARVSGLIAGWVLLTGGRMIRA